MDDLTTASDLSAAKPLEFDWQRENAPQRLGNDDIDGIDRIKAGFPRRGIVQDLAPSHNDHMAVIAGEAFNCGRPTRYVLTKRPL